MLSCQWFHHLEINAQNIFKEEKKEEEGGGDHESKTIGSIKINA